MVYASIPRGVPVLEKWLDEEVKKPAWATKTDRLLAECGSFLLSSSADSKQQNKGGIAEVSKGGTGEVLKGGITEVWKGGFTELWKGGIGGVSKGGTGEVSNQISPQGLFKIGTNPSAFATSMLQDLFQKRAALWRLVRGGWQSCSRAQNVHSGSSCSSSHGRG